MPVALSDDQFAREYLGITPRDILLVSDLLYDNFRWDQFWSNVRATIASSVALNPQSGDTPAQKAEKAVLKRRAEDLLLEWMKISTEKRDRNAQESDFVKEARSYVGKFQQIREEIVGNEVIRIGQQLFGPDSLAPTDIQITEVHSIQRQGALRSETEAAVKLPRSFTQVSVDLVFTGRGTINTKFRRLLAELYASPITTMESPFLTNSLVNHYSSPELEAEIKRRVQLRADSKGLTEGFDDLANEVATNFERLKEIFRSDDLLMEHFRQRFLEREDRSGPIGHEVTVEENKRLEGLGIAIPVALQDIVVSTDPNAVDTIHVRLSFLLFNARSFGAYGIEYRDNSGNRTPDIMKCTILTRYVEWAYLTKSADRGVYLDEWQATLNEDKPDLLFIWSDIVNPGINRAFPDQHDDFVVSSVQASLGIKIVPITVCGSKWPAVQVLGRGSVEAKVTIQTTNVKVVRDLTVMKDHLDAISRNVGAQFRDEYVHVTNSVLNMLGAKRFLISACRIVPLEDTSNAYQVELTLVQSEYTYREQESLVLKDSTVPEDAIRALWAHLRKKWKEYKTAETSASGNKLVADTEADMAAHMLFGAYGGRSGQGIVTPDLFVAGVLRLFGTDNGRYNDQAAANRAYRALFLDDQGKPIDKDYDYRGGRKVLQTVGDPGTVEFEAVSGRHFLHPQRAQFLVGNWLRIKISDDTAARNAFGVLQTLDKDTWEIVRGLLLSSRGSSYFDFYDAVWDSMLEVLMDVRESPKRVLQVWQGKFTADNVFDVNMIDRSVTEMQWLFTSGQVSRFSFNWQSFYQQSQEDAASLIVLDESTSSAVKRRLTSNYPDIPLPTYHDMFGAELAQTISNEQGESVPLWTRFAPTYSDLGVRPPDEDDDRLESMYAIAKEPHDRMEPAFWFFHHRLRREQQRRLSHAVQMAGQSWTEIDKRVLKVNVNTENFFKLSADDRVKTLYATMDSLFKEDEKQRDRIERQKAKRITLDIISTDGAILGIYRPKGPTASNNEYELRAETTRRTYLYNPDSGTTLDRRDPEFQKRMTALIMQNSPDETFAIRRAYPAFRLWFVEWDDNKNRGERERTGGRIIRMIDDLYTTNGVISMVVRDSKSDGAVAEVSILNTLGNFDTDTFLNKEEASKLGIKGRDDEGEDFLKRMRLQTGTGVLIQMGYSSDTKGLKTVFTGQITEIQPGKVITFIAQGYKAELDQEVSITKDKDNAAGAVRELIAIGQEGRANLTPHLGRVYNRKDLNAAQVIEFRGQQDAAQTGFLGLEGPNGFLARTFGATINSATRNVWVESNMGPSNAVGQMWQNAKEWFGAYDREWHFYNMTAWQGLEEMTRHLPGTVVAVRPFDTEGTVFFGYPDQPYQWRSPRGLELPQWYSRSSTRRVVAIGGLLPSLVMRFMGSEYGTTNKALEAAHLLNAQRISEIVPIEESVFNVFSQPDVFGIKKKRVSTLTRRINSGQVDASALSEMSPSYTGFLRWVATFPGTSNWYDIEGDDYKAFVTPFYANAWKTLPMWESLGFDIRPDWESLREKSPELQRFLWSYFFRIQYFKSGALNGDVEALLPQFMDLGMAPLIDRDGKLTDSAGSFIRMARGLDLEGDTRTFAVDYGDVFDSGFDSIRQLAEKAIEQIDDDHKRGLISDQEWQQRRAQIQSLLNGLQTQTQPGDLGVNRGAIDGEAKTLGDVLFAYFPNFRLFVHYFAKWLRSNPDAVGRMETDKLQALAITKLPPWFKPFRAYHAVYSEHDIVDNSIVASASEMYNTIAIRSPENALPGIESKGTPGEDDEGTTFVEAVAWRTWPSRNGIPFHPDLRRSIRRLAVAMEPNANTPERLAAVAVTNMCEAIRPMYRGELKILGKVVNPWDIVFIADDHSGMYGVVEVEAVVHEFNAETGWITSITPNAYCHPNNPYGLWQMTTFTDWASVLNIATNVLQVASIALFFLRGFAIASRIAATGIAESFVAKHAAVQTAAAGFAMTESETAWLAMTTAMQGEVKNAAAKGLLPGLVATITKPQAAAAVGKYVAQNWWPIACRLGRFIGFWGLAWEGIPVLASLLSSDARFTIHNTGLPVTMRPLFVKGHPLTAGLDLTGDHIETFSEKLEGSWGQIRDEITQWMKGATDDTIGQNLGRTQQDNVGTR